MKKRDVISYLILIMIIIIVAAASLLIGSADVSDPSFYKILMNIRLPRMLAAFVLGGALSVSGYLLQVFFSNPIAGPFVLGISGGAKLMTAIVLVMFLEGGIRISSIGMIGASFVGATISTGAVLMISRHTQRMSVLVLAGVMIGYICNALTEFFITFADDQNIVNLHDWAMGSFSGMNMGNVACFFVFTGIGILGSIALQKPIGAYLTGEEYARSVGVDIKRFRVILIMVSSLLSATVTAFAGPVSFVGVAVPHLMRRLFKTTMPERMIPACFLGGAGFCLFSDLFARLVFSPTELSISAVTAIFGAPVVIMVLLERGRVRE